MLKYIELTTGYHHDGPAWIGYATKSRSGQTVYFNGHALKCIEGGGITGNHQDLETGDEYWVSGVKKEGGDRHWGGCGKVLVERAALSEYLAYRGQSELDPFYEVTDEIIPTDIARLTELENLKEAESAVR